MERTISGMMGKGSLTHNRRAFTAENVDAERTKNNIEYCNESLKQVYHTLFDEAVNRYNAKQTRKDRMIDNYYDKIRTGKQEKLFHEAVFQIGNKDDMNVRGEHGELAKQILDEFMQDFQKRNPNLYVFSAHLHMDEETPHLHIDFVPYTTGSKRGLDTRVSLKQALKMQGFEGNNRQETEWNLWIESEKQQLSSVMERHGIQWLKLGTHRKHLSVLNFEKQERQKEVLQLDKQIEEASHKIAITEKQVKAKKAEVIQAEKELSKMLSNRAKVEKNIQTIQNDKEWQLLEPTTLMSAKTYKEKKAEPLVTRLKEVLQTVMINNLDLSRKLESAGKRLDQIRQQIKRLENRLESVEQENDVLKVENRDLKRLKMALGEKKVISSLNTKKRQKSLITSLKAGTEWKGRCFIVTEMEKKIMVRLCAKILQYVNLSEDKEADNLIQWVITSNSLKENNNEIRKVTADYKKVQPEVYSGIREALKANQEICKKRNELYEKQQDLKGKLFKIERDLER